MLARIDRGEEGGEGGKEAEREDKGKLCAGDMQAIHREPFDKKEPKIKPILLASCVFRSQQHANFAVQYCTFELK